MWNNQYTSLLRYLLGTSVLIMLGYYISNTNYQALHHLLLDMPFTFCWMVFTTFLAYCAGTVSWWYCIEAPYRHGIVSKMWSIRHVGEMLTIFNPTNIIAGDSLKNIYLQKLGIPKSTSRSSVVLSRVLLILSAIVLMLVSIPSLPYPSIWNQEIDLGRVGMVFMISLLLGPILLMAFRRFTRSSLCARLLKSKLIQEGKKTTIHFALFAYNHPGAVIKGFFFALGHWILGAIEIWILLQALAYDIHVMDAVLIEMGIQILKSFGFMIPGQVGVEEYANKIMLTLLSIPNNEVWLVLSLLRRARQLFWLGIAVLLYYYLKKNLHPVYDASLLKSMSD